MSTDGVRYTNLVSTRYTSDTKKRLLQYQKKHGCVSLADAQRQIVEKALEHPVDLAVLALKRILVLQEIFESFLFGELALMDAKRAKTLVQSWEQLRHSGDRLLDEAIKTEVEIQETLQQQRSQKKGTKE